MREPVVLILGVNIVTLPDVKLYFVSWREFQGLPWLKGPQAFIHCFYVSWGDFKHLYEPL